MLSRCSNWRKIAHSISGGLRRAQRTTTPRWQVGILLVGASTEGRSSKAPLTDLTSSVLYLYYRYSIPSSGPMPYCKVCTPLCTPLSRVFRPIRLLAQDVRPVKSPSCQLTTQYKSGESKNISYGRQYIKLFRGTHKMPGFMNCSMYLVNSRLLLAAR